MLAPLATRDRHPLTIHLLISVSLSFNQIVLLVAFAVMLTEVVLGAVSWGWGPHRPRRPRACHFAHRMALTHCPARLLPERSQKPAGGSPPWLSVLRVLSGWRCTPWRWPSCPRPHWDFAEAVALERGACTRVVR